MLPSVESSRPAAAKRAALRAHVLTAAAAVAATTFYVLCALYLVLPASSMPALIPGVSLVPDAPHRYRLAVATFVFGLMLSYVTALRISRSRAAVTAPAEE